MVQHTHSRFSKPGSVWGWGMRTRVGGGERNQFRNAEICNKSSAVHNHDRWTNEKG